jgi:hypothetical protein
MTAQHPKRRRGGSLTRKVATRQWPEPVATPPLPVNRELIRQALADSEAVWYHGWRSANPGVLVIPVDVAADVIVGLLERCFTEGGDK